MYKAALGAVDSHAPVARRVAGRRAAGGPAAHTPAAAADAVEEDHTVAVVVAEAEHKMRHSPEVVPVHTGHFVGASRPKVCPVVVP